MKIFLHSCWLLLCSFSFWQANAQCSTTSLGNKTFTTQAEVNDFGALYGNCPDIILGNVTIGDASSAGILSDITDLSPLANVKTITGYLQIRNNPNLLSLDGLNGFPALTSIGQYLYILNNAKLENISEFPALTSIGQTFYILNNANLENINGFSALASIGEYLTIQNNAKLKNINGFPVLASIGAFLRIETNAKLEEINGFPVLASIGTYLDIYNNAKLEEINGFPVLASIGAYLYISNTNLENINGFPTLASIGGYLYISDNAQLQEINGFGSLASVDNYISINDNISLEKINGFVSLTHLEEYLNIKNNPALTQLNGFSGLTNIGESLVIQDNNLLTNLNGLSAVTTIGGNLDIRSNDALTNLNSLSSLTNINGYIAVMEHDLLSDISGLANINPTGIGGGHGLYITDNPQLEVCNLSNFCTYLSNPGNPKTISGNKTSCIDEQAVLEACLPFGPDNNNILYVNSSVSAGNGNSWANAVPQLADALKWAKEQCDADPAVFDAIPLKIYVAQGTYKPLYRADDLNGSNPQDRDNAFVMVKNVQIYGGFEGTETTLEERNYQASPTILSGDIDAVSGLSADDAHHVIISAGDVGSALLDGFTVSGGYQTSADGNTSITVNNTAIRYERGSGLSISNSSPQIRNVIFSGNRAYAGVVSHTNSNATFVNTLFTGNTATYGTVYNNASLPIFTNSTIADNTGATNDNNGTAMRNVTSHPKLYNTIIWGNHTANGNINNIFNSGGASPTSIPEYYHSLVQGITNTSDGNLQGNTDPMFVSANNFRLKPCSPAVNAGSDSHLSGISTDIDGKPRIYGSAVDMGAYEHQGDKYSDPKDSISLALCPGDLPYIFGTQSLTVPGIYTEMFASVSGCDSTVTLNFEIAPVYQHTEYLKICSNELPYIFGTQSLTAPGIYTEVFISSNGCDSTVTLILNVMSTLYVDSSVAVSGDGSSWETAYSSLADAVRKAHECMDIDSILVAKGTYYPELRARNGTTDRDKSFVFTRGNLKILGAYPSGGGERDYELNKTILSGDVGVPGDSSDNVYHVVITAGTAVNNTFVLDGFTVTGGNANNSDRSIVVNGYTINQHDGGGWYNTGGASPRVSHVSLRSNTARWGAGWYNGSGNPAITNAVSSGNHGYGGGGGWLNMGGDPVISNVTISGNTSTQGAEWYNNSGTPIVRNAIIWGNGVFVNSGSFDRRYSLIQGQNGSGIGNIAGTTDPLFVNPRAGDFRLQPCSPAINAGNNAEISSGISTDIDGSPRIHGTTVDMGAYEYQGDKHFDPKDSLSLALCPSELPYIFGTQSLTVSGIYTEIFTSVNGCDSTVTLTLEVLPAFNNATVTACVNELPYIFGTQSLTVPGVYTEFFISSNGCDSTVTLDFEIYPVYHHVESVKICPDELPYIFGTQSLTASGIYTEIFTSVNGCDSTVTLDFDIYPVYHHAESVKICPDELPYIFGTQSLSAPGIYTEIFTSVNGCDSVVTLTLNVISTLYVDSSLAVSGDGSSWVEAYSSLAVAVRKAHECMGIDSILVAKGTYYPEYFAGNGTIDRDKSFVFTRGNLKILGAYPSGGGERNYELNKTILSGDIGVPGDSSDNAYHVVMTTDASVNGTFVLDGFTVTDGNANNSDRSIVVNGYTINQHDGGGWYNTGGASPHVSHVSLLFNTARWGAGWYNGSGNPSITNAVFSGNHGYSGGGGWLNMGGNPVISNVTISGNTSAQGAEWYNNSGMPVVRNSIIWGNGVFVNSGSFDRRYSLIQGQNGSGTGNIVGTTDPMFVNPSAGNFRLRPCSPAINAGNNAHIPAGLTTDLAGNLRIYESTVDMGAYEFQSAYQQYFSTDTIQTEICDGQIFSFWNHEYTDAGVYLDTLLVGVECYHIAIIELNVLQNTTVYVDSSVAVSGDGSSWGTAFQTMDEAIAMSCNSPCVDSILVAKGTYYPESIAGTGTTDRDKSFVFTRGHLKVLGGYPSGGGERNHTVNKTILSGDIGIRGDSTDNAHHVVITVGAAIDSTFVLNGFTISDGNADGSGNITVYGISVFKDFGGGMYNSSSSPTMTNVTISGNTADNNGGGMYNGSSLPVLTNVTISGNTADNNGGGMYNGSSLPVLTNVTISGNTADNNGGGMYNYYSSPVLTHMLIDSNIANNSGGGMYNSSSSPTMTNVTISGNTASSSGGGMYNSSSSSSPTMINVTISGNTTSYGGGMYNGSSSATMINVMISGNVAMYGGGMYNSNPSSLTLTNATISGNTAFNGGGMCNVYSSSPKFHNSIIWGNTATSGVDNFYNYSSTPEFYHSLVQGSGGSGSSSWTDFGTDGGNNIDVDPLFAQPATGDFRLQACSPAINAGNNTHVPAGLTTDLAGNLRIYESTVDMGAFEYQGDKLPIPKKDSVSLALCPDELPHVFGTKSLTEPGIYTEIFISVGGCDSTVTLTLEIYSTDYTEFLMICQDGFPYHFGTQALTEPGIYTELFISSNGCDSIVTLTLEVSPVFNNATVTVCANELPYIFGTQSLSAPGVYTEIFISSNGCDSTVTLTLDIISNTLYVDSSVAVSGDGSSWAMAYPSLADAVHNAQICMNVDTILVAKGTYYPEYIAGAGTTDRDKSFVFTRGNLKVLGGYPSGGGERNYELNKTILSGDIGVPGDSSDNAHHVVIIAGTDIDSSLVLDGFTITAANADAGATTVAVNGRFVYRDEGGGMAIAGAAPIIRYCTFTGNHVGYLGGGMAILSASPFILHCIFLDNVSGSSGGGIFLSGTPFLSHCIFSGNTAQFGGGMYNQTTFSIINSIFSGNTATNSGGGIYNSTRSAPDVVNTAFWGNTAVQNGGGIYNSTSPIKITNVTISGNTATQGAEWYNNVNLLYSGIPVIRNSIIWGNGIYRSSNDDDFSNSQYSLIQGEDGSGTGNIDGITDPMFVNPTAGDYRLQACSPAINAGNNVDIPAGITADIGGNTRIVNDIVDMGAYENQGYSLQAIANTALTASGSCETPDGWIHFYHHDDEDKIFVSVHPQGQNLGEISAATVLHENYGSYAQGLRMPYGQTKNFYPFNRSWALESENTFTNPVSIRFYFNETDSADVSSQMVVDSLSKLTLYKVDGNDIWNIQATGYKEYQYGEHADTSGYIFGEYQDIRYAEFQVTSFSTGTMAMTMDDAILPLDLLSFTAAAIDDNTYLQWHTVNEENVSHFGIERSIDAKNWETISTISALNGIEQHYDVWDESPLSGTNYYRLKMTDFDDTYKYSKIVEVSFGQKRNTPQYLIYPNPNNGTFHVLAQDIVQEETRMYLFDGLSRLVYGQLLQDGNNLVNTKNLVRGMYHLKIENKGEAFIYKVVVE